MKKILFCSLTLLFYVAGCAIVNVNIVFPEEKIEKAAEELLGLHPYSINNLFSSVFTKPLYAQETVEVRREIKTDSPVIKAAKQKMDSWRTKINSFKKEGFIGEKNNFELEVRKAPTDSSVAREVIKLVREENRERKIMMEELLKINNVAPSEKDKFKNIFTRVIQKNSPAGTWIQNEQGLWQRK